MIKEQQISLFDTSPEYAIVHQANCFCTMGSGVAKLIADRYPEAKAADDETKPGEKKKLGTFTYAKGKDGRVIFNAYSQFKFGGERETNYEAFYVALTDIRRALENRNKAAAELASPRSAYQLAIPYGIGCVRGGGSWRVVKKMIEVIFEDADFDVLICRLPGEPDLK